MIFQLEQVCRDLHIDEKEFFPESPQSFFEYEIVSGDFWSRKKETEGEFLYFKNSVKVMNTSLMEQALPALSALQWKEKEKTPYFTFGLENIQEALEKGRKIGIEGGPCLFGAWEVFMELTMKDGSVQVYDFNTGDLVRDGQYVENEPDLMEAMRIYADEIQEIHFRDEKEGLTGLEIASVLYLFEAAAALDAQVVLSIPDFSYVKFLKSLLRHLDGSMGPESADCEPQGIESQKTAGCESQDTEAQEQISHMSKGIEPWCISSQSELRRKEIRKICENCLAEFRTLSYRITDLYLDLAKFLEKKYPEVSYEPVHERRQDLCRYYEEKRAPYIERNKILRTIRTSEDRFESLKDYISLSTLPFYLFGITDILHICSIDEADSWRKCRKAHKGSVSLSCLLYPEYLSADGKTTVFYAEKQYKDYYVRLEDYFAEKEQEKRI